MQVWRVPYWAATCKWLNWLGGCLMCSSNFVLYSCHPPSADTAKTPRHEAGENRKGAPLAGQAPNRKITQPCTLIFPSFPRASAPKEPSVGSLMRKRQVTEIGYSKRSEGAVCSWEW